MQAFIHQFVKQQKFHWAQHVIGFAIKGMVSKMVQTLKHHAICKGIIKALAGPITISTMLNAKVSIFKIFTDL